MRKWRLSFRTIAVSFAFTVSYAVANSRALTGNRNGDDYGR